MQDKDPFAYQFNKDQVSSARSEETTLITLERSQKLDLLIHLISNLRQSLAICGPQGIGKTTLLDELKARKNDVWKIVTIQATGNVSFEDIQQQILTFLIKHYPEHKNQELSSVLTSLDKHSQKVVVLIDDAGQLVPGVISNVIQYAVASESLRVVFSLTQDELHLKNSSDKSISDCHFIEIPPLTEKQCGLFLQNLSGKPDAIISFKAISEQLVERLYRQTHGIPGKIVAELPKLSNYKGSAGYGWLAGVFFMAIAVAVGLKFFVFDGSDRIAETEKSKTALVLKKPEDVKAPIPQSDIKKQETTVFEQIELKAIEPEAIERVDGSISNNVEQTQVGFLDKKQVVQSEAAEVKLIEPVTRNLVMKDKPPVLKQAGEDKIRKSDAERKEKPAKNHKVDKNKIVRQVLEAKKIKPEAKKTKSGSGTSAEVQWLLSQPKNNYTIQLMVLSNRRSADKFLAKNKNLKTRLKLFQLNKKSEKYAIIYGSFKNSVDASKQMESLPAKYRKSWVRKISALLKEIKK